CATARRSLSTVSRSTRVGWVTVSPAWFRATRTVEGRLGWSYPEPSRRVCDGTRTGPPRLDRGPRARDAPLPLGIRGQVRVDELVSWVAHVFLTEPTFCDPTVPMVPCADQV